MSSLCTYCVAKINQTNVRDIIEMLFDIGPTDLGLTQH
jgi:hypothetical protein